MGIFTQTAWLFLIKEIEKKILCFYLENNFVFYNAITLSRNTENVFYSFLHGPANRASPVELARQHNFAINSICSELTRQGGLKIGRFAGKCFAKV